MPTPSSPESAFWIIAACTIICVTVILMEHRAATRVYRMCEKLLEANRILSLTIAHPVAAARLEQQRQSTVNDQQRKVALSDILGHHDRQKQVRFKQDRAANPSSPASPPALRFVPLDDDIVPPKERTPAPEEPKA